MPDSPPIARLVLLHGYGDHAGRHQHVLEWFARHGVASYAVDFRGHGRSAGKFGYVHQWDEYLEDLTQFLMIQALRTPGAPMFLLAHSHGGLVAIHAAFQKRLDRFTGVILVAPYLALKMPVPRRKRWLAAVTSRVYPWLQLKSGLSPGMLTRDSAMVERTRQDPYSRGIATPRWFTQSQKAQQQAQLNASQFTLPLLMLLPGQDTVANTATSVQFFKQCPSLDKTIHHFPDDRHELMRELDREKVFEMILQWMAVRLR